MLRTPTSVNSVNRLRNVTIDNPTAANIQILAKTTVRALTKVQLLRQEVVGLRESLLHAKKGNKRRYIEGIETRQFYTNKDIITIREETKARKQREAAKPKRTRRKKIAVPIIEGNSNNIVLENKISPPPNTVEKILINLIL